MARVHGKGGQLYMAITSSGTAEAIAYIKKWSANFGTDNVEVTAFGDSNKVYVSGLPDASGDFEGFFDDATAQTYTAATDGVARKFYLYPKTPSTGGPYWYGTAFFDFSVEAAIDGAVTIKGDFVPASTVTKIGG